MVKVSTIKVLVIFGNKKMNFDALEICLGHAGIKCLCSAMVSRWKHPRHLAVSILLSNINTFHRNGKQVEASSSEGIKCHKDSMKKELYVESGIDI